MKVMTGIFLKLVFNILKNYMTLTMIYYFYLKKMKIEKTSESLLLIYIIKLNMLFTLEM